MSFPLERLGGCFTRLDGHPVVDLQTPGEGAQLLVAKGQLGFGQMGGIECLFSLGQAALHRGAGARPALRRDIATAHL